MDRLSSCRKKIDSIDRKIVGLLKSRFKIASRISSLKKSGNIRIADKKRELEVLGNVKMRSRNHHKFLIVIFKKIISYSKKLQK